MVELKKLAILIAVVVGLFVFVEHEVQAATITWDGGGATNNWSEDANWSGDVEPGASDIAAFDGTSVKDATIDANIGVAGIDINTGYSGIITQASGVTVTVGTSDFDISSGTFTGGDSTITTNDAFTVSGGTFTSTSGTFAVDGAFTVSSGTFDPGTGTVQFQGANLTVNVSTSETFNNVVVAMSANNTVTITSGDTLVVGGTLTLTDGLVATGTLDARGAITQASTFDGGSAVIQFGDAGAQTYTINGGTTPTIQLDEAADASDSISFAAAATVSNLTVTSGFSGTVPISNAGDHTLTFTTISQAAGTIDASSQSQWTVTGAWTISGGTFTAPTTVTTTGAATVTWNVNSSQTFNNLTISKTSGFILTVASGDTLVVTGTLTLTDGVVNTGTIEARGSVAQASTFDGGSVTIEFGDAGAQTYTINGGTAPVIQLDEAADASDTILFNAAATVAELEVTAGFSGTIPISNPTDYTLTISYWNQSAGTYDASAQTQWNIQTFLLAGGSWTPPVTTVIYGAFTTWNVDTTHTFQNLTLNKSSGNRLTLASGDSFVVTGTLTLTDGVFYTGTILAEGAITQANTFDGGFGIVEFSGAAAQTYTINGGVVPVIQLDEAADASDTVLFNAAATVTELEITADFSGAIPVSHAGDYTHTFVQWNQSAGTYDASAQTQWNIQNLVVAGGAFTPPVTTVINGSGSASFDVNTSQTFNNLTVSKTSGFILTIGTGDTLVATGTLTLSDGVTNGGTLQAEGDVTVSSGYDAGTSTLTFSGSATQTFTLTGATGSVNSDITVNKSGGQVNLASALVADAASQDLVIQEGAFNLNGQNLTVNGSSGTVVVRDGGNFQLQGGETITLNASNPTLSSGSTVTYTGDGDAASDTYTVTTLEDVYHHLVINSTDGATDTFQLGAALDVNGNLTVTAGTFDVSASNYAITLAGNWSNSGTFNGRSGTVTLDGADQALTGATTFYSLTKTVASAATLTLPASTTQTIANTLTLQGASGQLLSLRSSLSGTQARIDPQGTRSVQYLDVQDNNNINATAVECSTGCASSGNNTNWTLPGVTVSSISGNTTEAGGTATFTVVLITQPSSDVSIGVTSNDTTEGTVSPSTLTFTNLNWSTPQTVTVTGVNDDVDDGNIAYTAVLAAASSVDASYNGLNPSDVSVTNEDNDTAGITLTESGGSSSATEGGATDTYTLVLASEPTSDVVITITDDAEADASPTEVTFTSANWDEAQTITITATDDEERENAEEATVSHSVTSADSNYNNFVIADVTVSITDDDNSGTAGYVSGNQTYTVELLSPNGGETYQSGEFVTITWTSTGFGMAYVNIALSTDGGNTYQMIEAGVTNTGYYSWEVPDVNTQTAKILVEGTDLDLLLAEDDSDSVFTIVGTVTESDDEDGDDAGSEDEGSGGGEGIDTVEPHSYIKGHSFAEVYYIDGSLYRHPIFNESIYFTHNDSWSVVRVVSDATLPTLAIKGVVLPKPGVVLVKVQSVPHVYAVFEGEDGSTELRWIQTEEIATEMYGEDWADYVIDIPPTFWTKFTFGPDISEPISVDLSIMKKRWELTE